MVRVGEKVKEFVLDGVDSNGKKKKISLSDFAGENLLLYFYPADDTPGCTTEACDFRDNLNRLFHMKKVVVVGVSPDPVEKHVKFREKYGLNFPLLSDANKIVMKYFGAYGEKNLYGKVVKGVKRSTFLIDKEGLLVKEWKNVKAIGHVDKLLRELE